MVTVPPPVDPPTGARQRCVTLLHQLMDRRVISRNLLLNGCAIVAADLYPAKLSNSLLGGDDVRMAFELFKSMSRNEVVRLIMQMSTEVMGADERQGG